MSDVPILGNNGTPQKEYTLIIHFIPSTFQLKIEGDILNIEMMRSVLQQADRFMSREQDKMAALQLQTELNKAAGDQTLLRQILEKSRKVSA